MQAIETANSAPRAAAQPGLPPAAAGSGSTSQDPVDRLDGVSVELYQSLRQIAHRQLFRLGRPATLCTTALVNESYLKLAESHGRICGPGHFQATMARVMPPRQYCPAQRRGGDQLQVSLGRIDVDGGSACDVDELLAIDAALLRMRTLDARLERVTEMRLFGGFSVDEIAGELGVSAPTVKRELRTARAFLASELALGAVLSERPVE